MSLGWSGVAKKRGRQKHFVAHDDEGTVVPTGGGAVRVKRVVYKRRPRVQHTSHILPSPSSSHSHSHIVVTLGGSRCRKMENGSVDAMPTMSSKDVLIHPLHAPEELCALQLPFSVSGHAAAVVEPRKICMVGGWCHELGLLRTLLVVTVLDDPRSGYALRSEIVSVNDKHPIPRMLHTAAVISVHSRRLLVVFGGMTSPRPSAGHDTPTPSHGGFRVGGGDGLQLTTSLEFFDVGHSAYVHVDYHVRNVDHGPGARCSAAATALPNGLGMAVHGGYGVARTVLSDLWLLSPVSTAFSTLRFQWREVALTESIPRMAQTLTCLDSRRLLIVGGYTDSKCGARHRAHASTRTPAAQSTLLMSSDGSSSSGEGEGVSPRSRQKRRKRARPTADTDDDDGSGAAVLVEVALEFPAGGDTPGAAMKATDHGSHTTAARPPQTPGATDQHPVRGVVSYEPSSGIARGAALGWHGADVLRTSGAARHIDTSSVASSCASSPHGSPAVPAQGHADDPPQVVVVVWGGIAGSRRAADALGESLPATKFEAGEVDAEFKIPFYWSVRLRIANIGVLAAVTALVAAATAQAPDGPPGAAATANATTTPAAVANTTSIPSSEPRSSGGGGGGGGGDPPPPSDPPPPPTSPPHRLDAGASADDVDAIAVLALAAAVAGLARHQNTFSEHVVKIQSVVRGHLTRAKQSIRRPAPALQRGATRANQAVVKIQKVTRGWLVRSKRASPDPSSRSSTSPALEQPPAASVESSASPPPEPTRTPPQGRADVPLGSSGIFNSLSRLFSLGAADKEEATPPVPDAAPPGATPPEESYVSTGSASGTPDHSPPPPPPPANSSPVAEHRIMSSSTLDDDDIIDTRSDEGPRRPQAAVELHMTHHHQVTSAEGTAAVIEQCITNPMSLLDGAELANVMRGVGSGPATLLQEAVAQRIVGHADPSPAGPEDTDTPVAIFPSNPSPASHADDGLLAPTPPPAKNSKSPITYRHTVRDGVSETAQQTRLARTPSPHATREGLDSRERSRSFPNHIQVDLHHHHHLHLHLHDETGGVRPPPALRPQNAGPGLAVTDRAAIEGSVVPASSPPPGGALYDAAASLLTHVLTPLQKKVSTNIQQTSTLISPLLKKTFEDIKGQAGVGCVEPPPVQIVVKEIVDGADEAAGPERAPAASSSCVEVLDTPQTATSTATSAGRTDDHDASVPQAAASRETIELDSMTATESDVGAWDPQRSGVDVPHCDLRPDADADADAEGEAGGAGVDIVIHEVQPKTAAPPRPQQPELACPRISISVDRSDGMTTTDMEISAVSDDLLASVVPPARGSPRAPSLDDDRDHMRGFGVGQEEDWGPKRAQTVLSPQRRPAQPQPHGGPLYPREPPVEITIREGWAGPGAHPTMPPPPTPAYPSAETSTPRDGRTSQGRGGGGHFDGSPQPDQYGHPQHTPYQYYSPYQGNPHGMGHQHQHLPPHQQQWVHSQHRVHSAGEARDLSEAVMGDGGFSDYAVMRRVASQPQGGYNPALYDTASTAYGNLSAAPPYGRQGSGGTSPLTEQSVVSASAVHTTNIKVKVEVGGSKFQFNVKPTTTWDEFIVTLCQNCGPVVHELAGVASEKALLQHVRLWWIDEDGDKSDLMCEVHYKNFLEESLEQTRPHGRIVLAPKPAAGMSDVDTPRGTEASHPLSAQRSGSGGEVRRTPTGGSAVNPDSDAPLPGGQPRPPVITSSVRWTQGKLLGKGSYGEVWSALDQTGQTYAVKKMLLPENDERDRRAAEIAQEVNLLSHLDHPNIVRFLGTQRSGRGGHYLYIFMEYMDGGSVAAMARQYGSNGTGLHPRVIQTYCRQILLGLQYLHSNNVVHRDIKGDNILCDHNGNCKLADFGASKIQAGDCTATASGMRGTVVFFAPEITKENRFSTASDIWAVGCTLLEMATGKPPWTEVLMQEHREKLQPIQIYYRICEYFKMGRRPPYPQSISPAFTAFLDMCFRTEPRTRPGAAELLSTNFVRVQEHSGPNDPVDSTPGLDGCGWGMERAGDSSDFASISMSAGPSTIMSPPPAPQSTRVDHRTTDGTLTSVAPETPMLFTPPQDAIFRSASTAVTPAGGVSPLPPVDPGTDI